MKKVCIAIVIERSRSYGQGLLRGIAKYGRYKPNWSFTNLFTNEISFNRGEKVDFNKLLLDKKHFDGIIAHVSSQLEVEELAATGIPLIIQSFRNEISYQSIITADDKAIGQMAAKYLINKGFVHFAYCGLKDMFWSQNRADSFAEFIKQHGFDVRIFNEKPQKNVALEQEYKVIADWLLTLPTPIGLMCCNDDQSRGIYAACNIAGLKVPQDVSIISVDNDELVCELTEVPLTSIELATEQAGYEAADMLDKIITGTQTEHGKVMVRPRQVIARRSTDFLAIDDLDVAQSVLFIKNQASEIITVDDVVNASALSRRMLEIRFTKILDKTINEIIQIEHLNLAKQLLTETRLPMSHIASKSGFSNSTYMAVVFKKLIGTTPFQFRKTHQV